MNFIDEFSDMLNDTITINPIDATTPRDVHGAPNYGTGKTYEARIVRKSRLVRSTSGDEVLSSFHVWVGRSTDSDNAAPPDVDPRDQIILSDGGEPTLLAIERFPDETNNISHTKLFFR